MSNKFYKDHALALFDLGYKPIPIRPNSKIPYFDKGESWKVEITREKVKGWAANGKGDGGIALTGLMGMDVDVTDVGVAKAMAAYIDEICPGSVRRFGKAPKFLVPLNYDLTKKRKITRYDKEGNKQELELLAPEDQYFLIMGFHPDTGQEYKCIGGDILDIRAEDLPTIEEYDLAMIEDEFVRLADEAGWSEEKPREADKAVSLVASADPFGSFDDYKAPGKGDPHELTGVVLALPMYWADERDKWAKVLAVVHHECGGSEEGFRIALDFSRRSPKFKGVEDVRTTYNSFSLDKTGRDCATIATLVRAVQETRGIAPALQRVERPEEERQEFDFVDAGLLTRNIRKTKWLIEGVIPEKSLSCLFGDPGSFKSFMAADWAASIATGTPWCGHKIQKSGPVFIIIGEGIDGYGRRLRAWEEARDVTILGHPLRVSTMAAQFLNENSARKVGNRIREMSAGLGAEPVMVFIDTLFRNFGPGDINSSADMCNFIAALDHHIGLDCGRQVVHHTGHSNKQRAQGSSALLAAVDVEYRMEKLPDGSARLTNLKMKDEAEWKGHMTFIPQTYEFEDVDGELVDSICLQSDGELAFANEGPTKGKIAQALDVLADLIRTHKANKIEGNIQGDVRVKFSDWQKKCEVMKIASRAHFYRLEQDMKDGGMIVRSGIYVDLAKLISFVS